MSQWELLRYVLRNNLRKLFCIPLVDIEEEPRSCYFLNKLQLCIESNERGSHQVTSIVYSSLVKIVLELSSGIFMMRRKCLRKGSRSSNSENSPSASATSTTTTTPDSTTTPADQSACNISSKHRQEEVKVRAEVEALVRRVVPEEADNIDEMMAQFKGREEELIEKLRRIQERAIARRARLAVQMVARVKASPPRSSSASASTSCASSGHSVRSVGSTKSEF